MRLGRASVGDSIVAGVISDDAVATQSAVTGTLTVTVVESAGATAPAVGDVMDLASATLLQKLDGQWARAKGFDTFCPLGPWIETELDPTSVDVRCTVNGIITQNGNTSDMVYGVRTIIAEVSAVMTLNPGDVIMTGTPAGVGPIVDGDVVTVECAGIGLLSNPVVAAS